MKKNKIDFFNEYIYYEKIDNGLEIYILPNNKKEDIFVTLTTKYGGCNSQFMYNDKYIKVPTGIAHFLEHKMFEQEDNIDPFSFFGSSGTYCNASTNYYNTSYIFAGSMNFKNNLNYLLDFIQNPYFTDENVLKEKGIIKEEIKMYDDMPDRIIYEKILYNIFNKHPIRYSIGGKVSDIEKITKEDLYKCYDVFYQPSNMFITITGNVNPQEAIDIIKENQSNKKFNNLTIKEKNIKEENSVYKEKEIYNFDIATPYVAYGIKIPLNKLKKINDKKRNIYLSTIFNILFDDTSLFYERLKESGIIETPIEIESIDTKDHKVFILMFKSNNYNEVIKEIENVLNNIKIEKEDLERKKKVYISYLVYMLDDISEANRLIVNNKILYNELNYNIHNLIKEMNIVELEEIINGLDTTNKSLYIIEK